MPTPEPLIAVDIVALVTDQANSSPVVVLHDRKDNRLLPIWIGEPEARAISIALNKTKTSRPLTHQLLLHVVSHLHGKLSRVAVDRMDNHTYFATLFLQAGERIIGIDCRPSDAVALALEAKVPIFVAKSVMDQAGQLNPFPGIAMRQEKREFKEEDMQKLKAMLEKARQREEQQSGG